MIKNFILTALVFASSLIGTSLQGDDFCERQPYYVGGFVGVNARGGSDFRFAGGISGGYKFENNARVESEFAYRESNTFSLMANAYYDFVLDYNFTPYLGVGIGYAHNEEKRSGYYRSRTCSNSSFAFQAIVGVSYEVCELIHTGIEYRYFAFKNSTNNNAFTVNVKRYF